MIESTGQSQNGHAAIPFGLLRRTCEPLKIIASMPGDVPLICAECGCASDEHARGWGALTGEDPDGLEPTSVVIMCPVCAALEFGWRPEAAEDYT